MSAVMSGRSSNPWYKQGWPWFLIALPATAVVAGFITLWIAINSWDGLVVDDYYQQGKAIEQSVGRTLHARELGLAATLAFSGSEVSLSLSAAQGAPLSESVIVTIAHPTHEGHDQVLRLNGANGVFSGPVAALTDGRWHVQIEDESRTWRLNGTVHLPAEKELHVVADGDS